MELYTTLHSDVRLLLDANGRAVARFANDEVGLQLYGFVVDGLARTEGASIYDEDKQQYQCGTVAQLQGELE